MEKEYKFGKMVEFTRASGKMGNQKESVDRYIVMEIFTKDNGNQEYLKDSDNIFIKMGRSTKDNVDYLSYI